MFPQQATAYAPYTYAPSQIDVNQIMNLMLVMVIMVMTVSYTHLTLPTKA